MPRCQRSTKHRYCYFSSCEEPQLQNARVSVSLHKSKGENFKIECKDGYILPSGKSVDTVLCNKTGSMKRAIFDCIPKEGDIIFEVGSTNFKCRRHVRIVAATAIDVGNNVTETMAYLDKCAQSSACR